MPCPVAENREPDDAARKTPGRAKAECGRPGWHRKARHRAARITPRQIVEVNRIGDDSRIIAFRNERSFRLLERVGRRERALDAHKERPRIGRQARRDMAAQLGEIEMLPEHQRRHAGAPVGTGNGDAINDRFSHLR